jgi:hypothetical protein
LLGNDGVQVEVMIDFLILGLRHSIPGAPSVMLPHIHGFHPWLLQYSICLLMCCIKMPLM